LARVRQLHGGKAGQAVLRHIIATTAGVRHALQHASVEGKVLATGPIHPGIRACYRDGVFFAGNAAGEAHPIIAEGISMAMQSAWLLARHLITWRERGGSPRTLNAVEANYAQEWRRSFAPRLYAAAGVAQWALRPTLVAGALPLLRRWPRLLTVGARLSGKATCVVRG
jgi:flavin-dependent dehydrogenase